MIQGYTLYRDLENECFRARNEKNIVIGMMI